MWSTAHSPSETAFSEVGWLQKEAGQWFWGAQYCQLCVRPLPNPNGEDTLFSFLQNCFFAFGCGLHGVGLGGPKVATQSRTLQKPFAKSDQLVLKR